MLRRPVRLSPPARRAAPAAARRVRRALLLGALLAVPALPGGAAGAQVLPAGAPGLRPGDQVRIAVWRNPELSGDFTIGGDGTIQHPLYRSIVAAGAPVDSIEARVAALLRRFESEPQFVVQPLVRVAVGGQVRAPSLYLLPPSTTVGEAIMAGGGVGDEGRLNQVRLIRQGREQRLDLTRDDLRDAMVRVASGDQLVVGRGRSFFADVLLPTSSLVAAIGSIVILFTRR